MESVKNYKKIKAKKKKQTKTQKMFRVAAFTHIWVRVCLRKQARHKPKTEGIIVCAYMYVKQYVECRYVSYRMNAFMLRNRRISATFRILNLAKRES